MALASSVSAAATSISSSETLAGSQRSIHLIRLRQVSMEIPICAVTFPLSVTWSLSWTSLFKSPQFRHFSMIFCTRSAKTSLRSLPATPFQHETPV